MENLLNLDTQSAYKSLCYLAGRNNLTTISSKVHSRKVTFKSPAAGYKAGEKIDVWYVRAHDEDEKNKYIIAVPVGKSMQNGFTCKPDDVELRKVNQITLENKKFHLIEENDIGQFILDE